MSKPESVNRRIIRSVGWMFSQTWCIQMLALVNTAVLARLLTPSDFGVYTAGYMALNFVKTFMALGVVRHLVRKSSASQSLYDTAWTFRLIQGCVIGLALIFTAPFIADYFQDPRVEMVVIVLGGLACIRGLENIGMVDIYKNLRFFRHFKFHVSAKLIGVVAGIAFAIMLRSYWALVMTAVVGCIYAVSLSYYMHPRRPTFCLKKWRELGSFAIDMTMLRAARFFNARLDVLVIGGMGNTSFLGLYNTASRLSRMMTNKMVGPINTALFPNFAKLANDRKKLVDTYLLSLSGSAIFLFPVGIGLSAVSDVFVLVILGDQWVSAGPLIQWLAIAAVLDGLCGILAYELFLVVYREKMLVKLGLLRLSIFAFVVFYVGYTHGPELIPFGMVIMLLFIVPVYFVVVARELRLTIVSLLVQLWRPLVSSGLMYFSVKLVPVGAVPPSVLLVSQVILGATVYVSSLIGLWVVCGKPGGIEHKLLSITLSRLRPVFGKISAR